MDSTEQTVNATPRKNWRKFLTLPALAAIGNLLWFLLFSVILIASIINWNVAVESNAPRENIFFFLILSSVIVLACLLCFYGLLRMRKGKKIGFYFYAIGNLIWIGALFYDLTRYSYIYPVLIAISLLFVIFFAIMARKYT